MSSQDIERQVKGNTDPHDPPPVTMISTSSGTVMMFLGICSGTKQKQI
jgi:hypothetical protein